MITEIEIAVPTDGIVTLKMTLAEAEEISSAIDTVLRAYHATARPDGPASQVLQGVVDAITTRPPTKYTADVQLIAGQPL